MGRPRTNGNNSKNLTGISIRQLKKELKLIPNDIKREMRFLDLLFVEKNFSRTQAEKEVLKDFMDRAKKMVEFHQNRLERYQQCYDQLKEKKTFDLSLLLPDELQFLRGEPLQADSLLVLVRRGGTPYGDRRLSRQRPVSPSPFRFNSLPSDGKLLHQDPSKSCSIDQVEGLLLVGKQAKCHLLDASDQPLSLFERYRLLAQDATGEIRNPLQLPDLLLFFDTLFSLFVRRHLRSIRARFVFSLSKRSAKLPLDMNRTTSPDRHISVRASSMCPESSKQ